MCSCCLYRMTFITLDGKTVSPVRNIQRRYAHPPTGSGPLEKFWLHQTGARRLPNRCRHFGCRNKAQRCAHVTINGDESQAVYIIPVCSYHIYRPESFEVNSGTLAVLIGGDEDNIEQTDNRPSTYVYRISFCYL